MPSSTLKHDESISARRYMQLLNCGLTSGLLQAGVFNPWDRALYLSVKHERAFLHMDNFRNPMAGVFQTLFQRAISTGLYFPLEDIFAHHAQKMKEKSSGTRKLSIMSSDAMLTFMAGTFAGACNGIMMNPIASIKVCIVSNTLHSNILNYKHIYTYTYIQICIKLVNIDILSIGCLLKCY